MHILWQTGDIWNKIYISLGSLVHDKNIQSWSIVTVGYFLLT